MNLLSSLILLILGRLVVSAPALNRDSLNLPDQTSKLLSFDDKVHQLDHYESETSNLITIVRRDDSNITNFFNHKIKECIMNEAVIQILFGQDIIICGDIKTLSISIQVDLIRYSKKYILNLFHLPSLQEISEMNILPDDQFRTAFLELLERNQFNIYGAAREGRTYIQKRIIATPGESSTLQSILNYYWRTPTFRKLFIDRAFSALSRTLSLQEYLEFESLLDWFHKTFRMLDTDEWSEVKDIFQKYYKYSRFHPKFWEAWRKRRPLEGVKYYG